LYFGKRFNFNINTVFLSGWMVSEEKKSHKEQQGKARI